MPNITIYLTEDEYLNFLKLNEDDEDNLKKKFKTDINKYTKEV